ncbi:MAG: hypothetical protein R2813_04845 [Flavobacteriales bacterium]
MSLTIMVGDSFLTKEVDTLFYRDEPFTGTLVEYFPSGQMRSSVQYAEGLKHGMSRLIYENGQIEYSRPYSHGQKHGEHLGYYESGAMKYAYYFEDGFSEGNHKEWYESGQLFRDLNYEHGYERGAQKMYREDGKLRGNYVVRENGRIYGLVGVKRCKNIDTENEELDELKAN